MPTLSVTSSSLPTLTRALLLFAALAGGAPTGGCMPMPMPAKERAATAPSIVERYKARFPTREMCAGSFPYRWWCPMAVHPTPHLTLPSQPTSYLGLSAWVADGDRVQEALSRQVGLSVLHVDQAGAALVALKSDDAEERAEMIRAYVSVARALQGHGDEILVTEEMHAYIDGQRQATPRYTITANDVVGLWTGQLDTYIWEAQDGGWGRVLVVVEDATGGMFVSLFPMTGLTDAPMPAREAADSTPEERAARGIGAHVGHGAQVVALRHARAASEASRTQPAARPSGGGGRGKKPTAGKKGKGGAHKGR